MIIHHYVTRPLRRYVMMKQRRAMLLPDVGSTDACGYPAIFVIGGREGYMQMPSPSRSIRASG